MVNVYLIEIIGRDLTTTEDPDGLRQEAVAEGMSSFTALLPGCKHEPVKIRTFLYTYSGYRDYILTRF